MTRHPSELELDDCAAGVLEGAAAREVEAHLDACADCLARVHRVRAFRARLAALPAAAEPARDLWPELAARLAATGPSAEWDDEAEDADVIPLEPRLRRRTVGSVWLQRAAAAAILFVGGVALGRGTASAPAVATFGPAAPGAVAAAPAANPMAAAQEIQRAGSAYVTAVANFAALYGAAGEHELEQGRDVALATMAGAARELARLPSRDSTALSIYRMVNSARGAQQEAAAPHAEPRTVRF